MAGEMGAGVSMASTTRKCGFRFHNMGIVSAIERKRGRIATASPHSRSINPKPNYPGDSSIHPVSQPSIKVDGTLP
jgi:hypothetical protein